MKITRWALTLALAVACCGWVQAAPQNEDHRNAQVGQEHRADQDRDRDRDRDHDRDREESRFYSNKYYQQGWKDGAKHKHSHRKWKNDLDREAYQAGYAHGERGEAWHKPDHHRDHDHH